ncbi:MAG: hypothetical protein JSR17_11525 [Proteobacteria bacterium]|nr:hypothetical protein [Pseudomonadota bacterium]
MLNPEFGEEDRDLQRAIDASLGKAPVEDEDEQMRRALEESRKLHEEGQRKVPDTTLAGLNEFLKSLKAPQEIKDFLNISYANYVKTCPVYSPKLKAIDFRAVKAAFEMLPEDARVKISKVLIKALEEQKHSDVNSFSVFLQFDDPEFAFVNLISSAEDELALAHQVEEKKEDDALDEDAELKKAIELSKQTDKKSPPKSTTPLKRIAKEASFEEKSSAKAKEPRVVAAVAAAFSSASSVVPAPSKEVPAAQVDLPAADYEAHKVRLQRIFSFMLHSIEAAKDAIVLIEKQIPEKTAQAIKDQLALITSYEKSTKNHTLESLQAFIENLNLPPKPVAMAFEMKREESNKQKKEKKKDDSEVVQAAQPTSEQPSKRRSPRNASVKK